MFGNLTHQIHIAYCCTGLTDTQAAERFQNVFDHWNIHCCFGTELEAQRSIFLTASVAPFVTTVTHYQMRKRRKWGTWTCSIILLNVSIVPVLISRFSDKDNVLQQQYCISWLFTERPYLDSAMYTTVLHHQFSSRHSSHSWELKGWIAFLFLLDTRFHLLNNLEPPLCYFLFNNAVNVLWAAHELAGTVEQCFCSSCWMWFGIVLLK